MAAIKGKDTKPEILVRKYLWHQGFRYRLNHPRLPGKPDIVLLKYRTVVFVNGCFWHGHNVEMEDSMLISSDCCKIPQSNEDFWQKKILRNRQRDSKVIAQLSQMHWNSITVWECQLTPSERERTLQGLALKLHSILLEQHSLKEYSLEEPLPDMAAEDEL